ncbi:acetylglutamate kinase [Ancylomarina sp. 16SWW S1-10-2]|uniref:acetylglutamate kinase n=1 Tax=Ancylomarina sp. 16SWW S1-10-2 TaxID=2499681 RepID=UPI0012AE42F4|nr:acetylglutamate kinase [Ancylomarina sp. 16SWW S1-10-2]MRT92785.1 acetylglutamate kinase [Ancylomarina sp. 16SWW S1-10-2]
MKDLTLVKIGGNLIDDESKLAECLKAFAKIKGAKLLVHGGGKLASEMAKQLGIDSPMIDGRRITNAETLKVVSMVYAGLINKKIVAGLQAMNQQAIGLCGADDNLILAEKRQHESIDYGFVGDVIKVNTEALVNYIDQNKVLVLSAITHDGKGQLLNTNADTVVTELAIALSENYQVKLIYSFEKSGVLINPDDDMSFLKSLDQNMYQEMKANGTISNGMLPKTENAFRAFDKGVKVIIGDLLVISKDEYSGTQLIKC